MAKYILYLNIIAATLLLTSYSGALAQNTSPTSIIEGLSSGNLSLNNAATELANANPNFSNNSAYQFLSQLNGAENVLTQIQQTDLLSTAMSNLNFDNAALQQLQGVVQNFQNLSSGFENIQGLIDNISSGTLPPQLAEAASGIIGNITSQAGLTNFLNGANIEEGLNALLEGGASAEAIAEAVGALGAVALNPEALQELGVATITGIVENALEQALPGLSAQLTGLLGGGLTSALSSGISSVSSGASVTPPTSGGGGDYEFFRDGPLPYEPHAAAVQKSCGSVCNCTACQPIIEANHAEIRKHMTDEMIKHRTWMIDVFFKQHVLAAMTYMTTQLSTVSVRQTYTIGRFFDAKHQLETERTLQVLMAEAHKDYQPSESLCEIGTFTKSLASSKRLSDLTQVALTQRMADRERKEGDSLSAGGTNTDGISRIELFTDKYCDVYDNQKGLSKLCTTGGDIERKNKDINFTRTILANSTLTSEPEDASASTDTDLQDVLAMSANLFASDLIPDLDQLTLATEDGRPKQAAYKYLDLRSIMAKRNVAQNTFAAIASERIDGSTESASNIKGLMVELGMEDHQAEELLGKNPSYYAQRKVLTSHAFENPAFYTELYESPTNTNRKSVALKAINLMLEDDFYDRQLESEMTLAVMLELMLEDQHVLSDRALSNLRAREN